MTVFSIALLISLPFQAAGKGYDNIIRENRALRSKALKNGCASGLAAACAKTALQPFDAIKTIQQGTTVQLNMVEAANKLFERSGFLALYSGLFVSIIGSMPSVFVYFAVYQLMKERLMKKWGRGRGDSGEESFSGKCNAILFAAAIGNFVASFLRPPYEILKQRLQAGTDATLLGAVLRIHHESGMPGFWQGLSAQMARDIPYAMATLLVYESLHAGYRHRKKELRGEKDLPLLTPLENGIIGAIAGGFGSALTNPMDVVKTRMMVYDLSEKQKNWLGTVSSIAQEEGLMAFWKGCTPRLLQKMPANAVFFLSYEFFRVLLKVEST
jgi:hypothetical protein